MKLTDRAAQWMLGCAVAGSLFAAGCSRQAPAAEVAAPPTPQIVGDQITFPGNAPQLAYLTVEAVRTQTAVATAITGRLAWDDDVTARVFVPVSGRVLRILAQPGKAVAAGEALAEIRSPDFSQAQADAHKAMTDLKLSARALARVRDLTEHHAAAQKDVESAQADYDRAQSEQDRALATLALYGGDEKTGGVTGLFVLQAPIAGVVVDRAISPGQEVRADQLGDRPLFTVSDPTRLWLMLDATESDASEMKPGQAVVVHSRALPDQVFRGRIEVIGEGLDPATRTVKARCLIENPERALRAEMYVSADVEAGAAGELEVPAAAVLTKGAQHYAFVETAAGAFRRREIALKQDRGGRITIASGLAPGERVVTDGVLLLEAMLEGENS